MDEELLKLGAAGLFANAWMKRLFGPSVDVIGEHLADLTRERLENVDRVAGVADKKAIALGLPEDNSIPLRVAGALFGPASFADQAVVADYLGGVLASSRSPKGEDDRGVAWTAQITRMSSDELRVHYILYELLRRQMVAVHPRDSRQVRTNSKLSRHQLALPVMMLPVSEEGEVEEDEAWSWILDRAGEALLGLSREGLLVEYFVGDRESLPPQYARLRDDERAPKHPLVVFTPSMVGVRLFLVAHGMGRGHLGGFVSEDFPAQLMAASGVQLSDDGDEAWFASEPCCDDAKSAGSD